MLYYNNKEEAGPGEPLANVAIVLEGQVMDGIDSVAKACALLIGHLWNRPSIHQSSSTSLKL